MKHEWYEKAKAFAKEQVQPYAAKSDREGTFPKEAIQALQDAGWFGLVIPKEYGGMGLGIAEHAEVCVALAEYDPSASLCYMMSNVGAYCLSLYASEGIKQEVLPKVAKGEAILGLAYSESGTGTHFYLPEMKEDQKADYAILNGRKSFVTTAREADYYITSAHNEQTDTVNLWVVDKNTAGLSFEHQYDGVGLRGNVSDPMRLDHAQVDNFWKIAGNGDGDRYIFIVGLAASSAGIAMAISREASRYVKERTYSTGKSLGDFETVEVNLADIHAQAYAAREVLFNAAQTVADGDADGFKNVIAARIATTRAAIENANIGMRLFGGRGFVRYQEPMERLMRDSYGAQVMAPGYDVLRVWLGRMLVDLNYLKGI